MGIQEGLEAVLNRVIDPASGEPVSRLGLVERFRQQPERRRLLVFCRHAQQDHACCLIFSNVAFDATLQHLKEALEAEFPDLTVQFVF
jgi:metal-sulfur cluster biosynthetic enzyme